MIRTEVRGGQEIVSLANRLRTVDRKAPGMLRTELRGSLKPTIKKVKQNVKGLDVSGEHGSTGLRKDVAKGVKAQAKAKSGAVRIVTQMPDNPKSIIPRGLDAYTSINGWRHPVYGNRDVWVTQPGYGWFIESIGDDKDRIGENIEDVLDRWNTYAKRGGGLQ